MGGRGHLKPPGEWKINVHRYEHTETWEAHYNIQLRKYDSETGQPLAGSKWDILEAFDDTQLDDHWKPLITGQTGAEVSF